MGIPGKLILGDYYQEPKTFSLTESQFSGKTFFYTMASRGRVGSAGGTTVNGQVVIEVTSGPVFPILKAEVVGEE